MCQSSTAQNAHLEHPFQRRLPPLGVGDGEVHPLHREVEAETEPHEGQQQRRLHLPCLHQPPSHQHHRQDAKRNETNGEFVETYVVGAGKKGKRRRKEGKTASPKRVRRVVSRLLPKAAGRDHRARTSAKTSLASRIPRTGINTHVRKVNHTLKTIPPKLSSQGAAPHSAHLAYIAARLRASNRPAAAPILTDVAAAPWEAPWNLDSSLASAPNPRTSRIFRTACSFCWGGEREFAKVVQRSRA